MTYESDYYVGADLNGDSLSHHGVTHQKWGVKNGPPYPIQRGHGVRYNVGKMTSKTKSNLQKSGKIKGALKSAGEATGDVAKKAATKVSTSFQKWKEAKKMDLATKDTNNMLLKNWQKKQLRISDMSNQELQQRIDRKRLEETYKHALRGDFSAPTTWKKGTKSDGQKSDGQKAAESILKRIGDAAVAGIAEGLTKKISNSMTTKSKGKTERREARRKALAEVATNAAKERAEYKAERRNEEWKARQEQKRERRERTRYDDGAMDPLEGVGLTSGGTREYSDYQSYYTPTNSANYYTPTNSTGIATSRRRSSDYYRASPGSWTIR